MTTATATTAPIEAPSQWVHIMSASEIDAHYALTASLDPAFARRCRAFYESRTPADLRALRQQAWNCNEPTGYQLARSFLALRGES